MRSHVVCRQTKKGKPRCGGFSLREDKSRGANKSGLSDGPEQKEKRPSESGRSKRRPDRAGRKAGYRADPNKKKSARLKADA